MGKGKKWGSVKSKPPPKRGGRVPKIASIDFDEGGRSEFISGFRKRKKQRQQVAIKQLEERERQDRLARRARKRKQLLEEREQRQQVRDVMKQEETNRGLLLARPFKNGSRSSAAEAASYDIGDVRVQVTTSTLEDLEEEELQRLEEMEMEESSDDDVALAEEALEEEAVEEELDPWDPSPLQWYEFAKNGHWTVRQSSYLAGSGVSTESKEPEAPSELTLFSLNLIGLEKWANPRYEALVAELVGEDGNDCSGPFDFVCLYEVPVVGLKQLTESLAIQKTYAMSDWDGSSFDKKTACGTVILARKDTWLPLCVSPIANKFCNTVMGRGCLTWKLRRTPSAKPMTLAAAYLEGKCSLGPKTRRLQLKQVLSNLAMVEHPVALVGDFGCYSSSESASVEASIEESQFSRLEAKSLAGVGDDLDRITVDESVALAMLMRKARRKPRTAAPDVACLRLPGESTYPRCDSARILGLTSTAKCPDGVFVSTHCPILITLSWNSVESAVTGKRKQAGGDGKETKKRSMG